MKVVLVLLDAFSEQYLSEEHCPFLCGMSKTGAFTRIRPIFAYTGIEYCLLTSTSMNVHGVWNDHALAPSRSANRGVLKPFLRVVDKISITDDMNKVLRYLTFKATSTEYGIPHLIPVDSLDLFQVVKGTNVPSGLPQLVRDRGLSYLRIEPRLGSNEPRMLSRLPNLLKYNDLILLKLNSLDRLGHHYGPGSIQVRERVGHLDALLEEAYNTLGEKSAFVVMSDHGMSPVERIVDLERILGRLPARVPSDYVAYIGTTYVSFWFANERARKKIVEALLDVSQGEFLSRKDLSGLGIDKIATRYGDAIFALKEGYAFFPDFYRRRSPPRGMHGYASSSRDAPVLIVARNENFRLKKVSELRHIDVAPTILDIMGVPIPSYFEGQSLLRDQ